MLIPVALIIKLAGSQMVVEFWEKWDKILSVLILFMAIIGLIFFLLPYLVKSRHNKKNVSVFPVPYWKRVSGSR